MRTSFIVLALALSASATVLLQNPRGSNNKGTNDNNQAVENTARLFNSRNLNEGGYHIAPPMYYYEESLLTVQWLASNGCGSASDSNCEFVLQYMCDANVRDGTTSNTIANTQDADTDKQYGRHESYQSFQMCSQRSRNMGLYTADSFTYQGQVSTTATSALYTRQSCSARTQCTPQRYGFECPEERDYYPYWHPSEWRDIAVFVSDANAPHPDASLAAQGLTICDYYKLESQNVRNKGWCSGMPAYNNAQECQGNGGMWTESGGWGIEAPECLQVSALRPNHIGAKDDNLPHEYVWRVPKVGSLPAERGFDGLVSSDVYEKYRHCALRIRYNVTSNDYDRWTTDRTSNQADFSTPAPFPLARNEPYAALSAPDMPGVLRNLSIATRTHMLGTVHQDRSFTFEIRQRPLSVVNRIHNLNVVGRRGNIVETFPATEYMFVPTVLRIKQYEWLHPQWTGSDNNPANEAGEGADTTDRHNIVQIRALTDNLPLRFYEQTLFDKRQAVRMAFAGLWENSCKSRQRLVSDNGNNENAIEEDPQNCGVLNPTSASYFDGDLQKMNKIGTFYYMCSRNNNFSNRGQKGVIVVESCVGSCVMDQINYIPGDRALAMVETSSASTFAMALIALLF